MSTAQISDQEFGRFQRFIHQAAGITLSHNKKALVSGRLAKRLQAHRFTSYTEYLALLDSGSAQGEVQTAVDLLTTNETYFFREARHFELLRDMAIAHRGPRLRVWSAACSSGEEPYTMAMVLADALPEQPWEIVGSDISLRVLQRARTGHYVLERTRHIPPDHLKRFCLKGIGEQQGTLLVERRLRARVNFLQVNLNTTLPQQLGLFDAVFLRNVMIYFNGDTKRQVVARVLATLRPGGLFCIGHSESLNDIATGLEQVAPSVYRKC